MSGRVVSWLELRPAIQTERRKRRIGNSKGHPFHYWRHRGDSEPPHEEHWCDYCVGFYGVPHDGTTHTKGEPCRFVGSSHHCACIDCAVYRWLKARPS